MAERLRKNLALRAGGLIVGLLLLIAPRTTLRLLERQIKVLLARQMLEVALSREVS